MEVIKILDKITFFCYYSVAKIIHKQTLKGTAMFFVPTPNRIEIECPVCEEGLVVKSFVDGCSFAADHDKCKLTEEQLDERDIFPVPLSGLEVIERLLEMENTKSFENLETGGGGL